MTHLAMARTASSGSVTARVKALTRFLLDGLPLPDLLKQYGQVLFALTTGAGAATLFCHYIRRHHENHAKIKLAVFHFTRMLENVPDFQRRLNDPHTLIKDLDNEVSRLIGIHLTQSEAASTMLQLKRKVWTDVDEQLVLATKRRKTDPRVTQSSTPREHTDAPRNGESLAQAPIDAAGFKVQFSSPSSEADIQEQLLNVEEEPEDVIMEDVIDSTPLNGHMPLQEGFSSHETSRSSLAHYEVKSTPCPTGIFSSQETPASRSTCQVSSSSIGGTTYQVPSCSNSDESPSSPTPAARQKSVVPSGYGLDYDDKDLYPPSPPGSTNSSPTIEHGDETIGTTMPLTVLEAATIRAFDPNAFGNRPYQSPVLSKPLTTIKRQPPPNTMAIMTGNIANGTWLLPVNEGISPQNSPASSTTEYRVAETRKYYNDVVRAREERRSIRDSLIRKADSTSSQQEDMAANEDKGITQETEDQKWSDPVLSYSNNEEDSADDIDASLPSLQSIESPPSAHEISPPLLSPHSTPCTPELSSPPLSHTSSSPLPLWDSSIHIEDKSLCELLPSITCATLSRLSHTPPNTPLVNTVELHTTTRTLSNTVTGDSPKAATKHSPKPAATSPQLITSSSSSKRRSRPEKVSVEPQSPTIPLSASKLPRRAPSKPDTPAGVRKSARKCAYKGSFTRYL